MLLSQTAEYALRAMACLAQADPEPLTSDQLAEGASIPSHYVSKVMRQLVVAELVTGRRGRGGGFRLSQPADAITFGEVLAAVGGGPDPDRCAFGLPQCNAAEPCPLHPSWVRLQDQYERWASTTTFAEAALQPHCRPPGGPTD